MQVVERRQPDALARAVQLRRGPARRPSRTSGSSSCHNRAPARVRGSRAPIEYGGKPGSAIGQHVRDERRPRPVLDLRGQRRATVRMSATTTSGSNDRISAALLRRAAPPPGRASAASRPSATPRRSARARTPCPRARSPRATCPTSRGRPRARAAPARGPSAIAGNACPGSPNAASSMRRRGRGLRTARRARAASASASRRPRPSAW